jgi:NodT family efflux transporter outer membrane factor (OMF) lipoprotein
MKKTNKWKPFSILLFLFFVSACNRQTEKEMAAVYEPFSLHETVDQAIASGHFEKGDWPEHQWWRIFLDPQLDAFIERGLQNHPNLKKAEARVQFAEANAKKIRSKLFPNLDANATDNWQYYSKYGFVRDFYPAQGGVQIPHKVNETDLTLNFSYEFDFWGKNRKMFAAALGIARAERIEKVQAELILATSIAFAYFQWQAHHLQLDLYSTWLESEENLNALSKARHQIGIDSLSPPLEQKESLEQLRLTVADLQKELEIDLYVLKSLLGEGPDRSLEVTPIPFKLEAVMKLPSDLGLDLLARRPDLMAQVWRAEAARQEIGVAKTEFYPDVNLMAFAGLSSISFNHLFSWDARNGALQPAIHLPLFTGGRLEANLSSKVAAYNEAIQSYNALLLDAVKEVASEITTFSSYQEQVKIQSSIVLAQKDLLDIARSRYDQGVDNSLAVLSTLEKVADQEIRKVELEKLEIFSFIRLIKCLGGGFHSDKIPSFNPNTMKEP